MYPGFRRGWQRRWNAKSIARHVNAALGLRHSNEKRVAITTLPITADVIGRLDVDAWLYYCVDDFSVWPGLDGSVMDALEREQAAKVDAAVAVSQTLIERLAGMRCDASLLTHGIDLAHWQKSGEITIDDDALPQWWPRDDQPVLLFWGVVDARLDVAWCRELARLGRLVLMGPQQSPDAALRALPGVVMPGPAAYADLPRFAAAADVLVMPYADLPVTRAMQPLKFKEYLATGKPTVVRALPTTRSWSDAADVLDDVAQLASVVPRRVAEGVPASQQHARQRLQVETWAAKAQVLGEVIEHLVQQTRA
jgi:glycosyltransferase involved in cell wall biosynthesis